METLWGNQPTVADLPTDTKQSPEMDFSFGTKAEALEALQALVRHSIPLVDGRPIPLFLARPAGG